MHKVIKDATYNILMYLDIFKKVGHLYCVFEMFSALTRNAKTVVIR